MTRWSAPPPCGQWLVNCNLQVTENDKMERAAAMWAAANQNDFDTARAHWLAYQVQFIFPDYKRGRKREAKGV
jgi:hypothetical protein